jgi:hypothetical protein
VNGVWDSIPAMRRIARGATVTAVVAYAFGLVALLLSLPLAVPAFVIGTTAVVIALFAGFRAAHLDEIAK